MLVFGAHDALFGLVWSHGCYVDEQTCFCVYPSRVDDVQRIIIGWVRIFRVDLQHIVPLLVVAEIKCMDRHVVIASKQVHCIIRHLDIDVGVPGHNLNDIVRRKKESRGGIGKQTLRFHHQPKSVPCMIQVSAPMSAIEKRYDCMRRERFVFCSSYGRVWSVNLGAISLAHTLCCVESVPTVHRNEDES